MKHHHVCEPSLERNKTINGKSWNLCQYCDRPLSQNTPTEDTQLHHSRSSTQPAANRLLRTPNVPRGAIASRKNPSKDRSTSRVVPESLLVWIKQNTEKLGIHDVYEANRILEQLSEPFMLEHVIWECGEERLIVKLPYFESRPNNSRATRKPTPRKSARTWKTLKATWTTWKENEQEIAKSLAAFPLVHQNAVREILRMWRDQQQGYTRKTGKKIEAFLSTFEQERKRISDLNQVLSRPSLFNNELPKSFLQYFDHVNQELDCAEGIVRNAQMRLAAAMNITKKSSLRKELLTALVNIIASVPGMNNLKASKRSLDLLRLANPKNPIKSVRDLIHRPVK